MLNQNDAYSGGVFSSDIDGGRAGAEICLTFSGITAVTSTNQHFTLPYSDCRIEIGGASGKMIFCRNGDKSLTIFCEQKGFAENLRNSSTGLLDEQMLEVKHSKAQNARQRWKIAIILTVIVALTLYGGYIGITWAAREAVMALPVSIDQQIGELAMSEIQHEGPEVRDEQVVQAVQEIIDRLKPHAAITDFEYKIKVIDADIMNAFALPGGHMVIYTGLLKKATRNEQIASIIAHEMSHASQRHGLAQISQSLTLSVGLAVLFQDTEGLVAFSTEIAKMLVMGSYSRAQETQADLEGLRMLHAAKIDPQGMIEMFTIMQTQKGQSGITIPSWLSTHPDMAERIKDIKNYIDALPKTNYNPLSCDLDAVLKKPDSTRGTTATRPGNQPVYIGQ
ncbi:MAG: M48 family metallopeptidase [bacterium]|nr:M48 family metallopeptidase [bacterium]